MATPILLDSGLDLQSKIQISDLEPSQILHFKHEVKLDTTSESRTKCFLQRENSNMSIKRSEPITQKENDYDRILFMFNPNQRKIRVKN